MMMEKIRKVLKSKGGFTLVELLVVIVVLGILAGVGVQQFGAVQDRAQTQVIEANARTLTGSAQMYYFIYDNNYPAGGDAPTAISALEAADLIVAGDFEGDGIAGITYNEDTGVFSLP